MNYHYAHIRAYWLYKAMSIPGGASSEDINLRIAYWVYISKLRHYNIICGELV